MAADALAMRLGNGANAGLGLIMAGALASDALRAARVNGQGPYVFAFGAIVCAFALFRAHGRALAAAAGVTAFMLATLVAAVWAVTPAQVRVAPLIGLAVLAGIVVQAQAARFAGPGRPGTEDEALASIEAAGTDTLAAIRRLVGLLRDPEDTPGASLLPEPIDQLVQRFSRHGPPVDLRLPGDLVAGAWPLEIASTLYRIVHEALTNVARHAPTPRRLPGRHPHARARRHRGHPRTGWSRRPRPAPRRDRHHL